MVMSKALAALLIEIVPIIPPLLKEASKGISELYDDMFDDMFDPNNIKEMTDDEIQLNKRNNK